MGLPTFTEADIRQQTSAESFQRGQEYCRSGAIESLVQRGATLQADVLGSDVEPYRVQVTFDTERLAGATCTCPYDWGGWCKHIVAALLAAGEQPETVEKRKPLTDVLASLNRDQLQALLLKLVQFQPDLLDMIEAQVPILAPTPTTPAPSPAAHPSSARPPIDSSALCRQVRSLLGHGDGGGRSWRGYG
jgi:uncharacterized Zn finger protein